MDNNQRKYDIVRDAGRLLDRQVMDYMRNCAGGHVELREYFNATIPVEIETVRQFFQETEFVQAMQSIGVNTVRRNDFNYELTLERRYICARIVTRRIAVMGETQPMYLMRPEDPAPIEYEERLLEELVPYEMSEILRSVPPPDPRATPYDYMREQERAYQREVERMTAIPPRLIHNPGFITDRLNMIPGGVTHMEEKKQPNGYSLKYTENGEMVKIPCYEEELQLSKEDWEAVGDALIFDE